MNILMMTIIATDLGYSLSFFSFIIIVTIVIIIITIEIRVTLFFVLFVPTFLCLYKRFFQDKQIRVSLCIAFSSLMNQKSANARTSAIFCFFDSTIAKSQRWRNEQIWLEIHMSGTLRETTLEIMGPFWPLIDSLVYFAESWSINVSRKSTREPAVSCERIDLACYNEVNDFDLISTRDLSFPASLHKTLCKTGIKARMLETAAEWPQ